MPAKDVLIYVELLNLIAKEERREAERLKNG